MSPSERTEVLHCIRDSASKIPHMPEVGDERCDYPIGYHLKVRLYENLLSSVFDILEEGQILAVSFIAHVLDSCLFHLNLILM